MSTELVPAGDTPEPVDTPSGYACPDCEYVELIHEARMKRDHDWYRCPLCGHGWGFDPGDVPDFDVFTEPPSIDELAAEMAAIAAETQELIALGGATEPTGQAVVLADRPAPVVKTQMAAARASLLKQSQRFDAAKAQLDKRMKAEMAKVAGLLGPLQEQVKMLEEGIWTVNLYLGRDEQITTLREGAPAPAATPITVRQLTLAMDEEHALEAWSGGLDAADVDRFDAWLLEDPENLQQVLPEQRGVVVLVPSRQDRHYSDNPWEQDARMEANLASYWLIRNGDQLFRMHTDIRVGKNLVPGPDEFTGFFTATRGYGSERRTVQLEPGTDEWLRAEKNADAHRRHFMRVALVLQGLIDRTTVFAPLPAETVNLLSHESYDAGYVEILMDDRRTLTTGRTPFFEWLAEKNSRLRVGMRIVGAFGSGVFYDAGRERTRKSPKYASSPESFVVHTLEAKAHGGFKFLYKRTDKRYGYEHVDPRTGREWGSWGEWEYKQRASCVIYPDDTFVIPIDLVTIDEMQQYVDARLERHAYRHSIPLIEAAIAVKRQEETDEEPVRQLLAGIIAGELNIDVAEALADLPDLISWWKLANRWHRTLVSADVEASSTALRQIVAEARRRRLSDDATDEEQDERIVGIYRSRYDVVAAFRRGDGRYTIFTRVDVENVYVREYTFPASKVDDPKVTEYRIPGMGWSRWRTLWTADDWAKWDHSATARTHLSPPEREQVAELIVEAFTETHKDRLEHDPLAVVYRPGHESWHQWKLYCTTEPEPIPPANRLWSETVPDVYVQGFNCSWNRVKGGGLEVTIDGYGHKFADRRWENEKQYHRGARPIWTDEAAIAAHDAVVAEYDAARALRREIGETTHQLIGSIVEQWQAFVTAAQYARFLEDYLDPDLWEGHAKTLDMIPFPEQQGWHHHTRRPDGRRPASEREIDFDDAVGQAVEQGRVDELLGRTVGEIFGDAYPEIASFTFRIPESRTDDDEDDDEPAAIGAGARIRAM